MAIAKTQMRGAAGALGIIAILLGGMVLNDIGTTYSPLEGLGGDAIYPNKNTVVIGEEVIFNVRASLFSSTYGVQYLVWNFNDGDYIYYSDSESLIVPHTFLKPGYYLVSILALVSPTSSKIFTVPITVNPVEHELSITSVDTVTEEASFTLTASSNSSLDPILNYIWDMGDGNNKIGKRIDYAYENAGEYTVRLRGYTNDSVAYVAFKTITVTNILPVVDFSANKSVLPDEMVDFKAEVADTYHDLLNMRYIWSFGDGLMDQGKEVSHMYTHDGEYNVTLTVIDNAGAMENKTRTITVENMSPIINWIYTERNYYLEGETVTAYADIDESNLDVLDYDWNVPADGKAISIPYFIDGEHYLNLTVSDLSNAKSSASGSNFTVINTKPYASLISATASYNITIITWGTLGADANITLYGEGNYLTHLTLNNSYSSYNPANKVLLDSVSQDLDEYYEIQVDGDHTEAYELNVQIRFETEYGSTAVIKTLNSECTLCVSDTYRFPVAPIDRGIYANYTFSIFDPGKDILTLYLNMGTEFTSVFQPVQGPASGTISVIGASSIPADQITYYVKDDGELSSSIYSLPLIDYADLPLPTEFILHNTSWSYSGHVIDYYAPASFPLFSTEMRADEAGLFQVFSASANPTSLSYEWHFGDSSTSTQQFPAHSYNTPGEYLVWVIIRDGKYEQVISQWITVHNGLMDYEVFMQGSRVEGNAINFDVLGDSTLKYIWEFDDETWGFGMSTTHAFTLAGNYTVKLHVYDDFGQHEIYQMHTCINNKPPMLKNSLSGTYWGNIGEHLNIFPIIDDSPYDLLRTSFSWQLKETGGIDGDSFPSRNLDYNFEQDVYPVVVPISDPDGAVLQYAHGLRTYGQDYTISVNPYYHVYGDTDRVVEIRGSILPFIDTQEIGDIEFRLSNLGWEKVSGTGVLLDNFRFSLKVNLSSIADEIAILSAQEKLQEFEDLNPRNSISGAYMLYISVGDQFKVTTLTITADQDGDFLSDDLEILYSNADDVNLKYDDSDSDGNNNADPVDYVLGNDTDMDGIPKFYEDLMGTSDLSEDSDGDGLTDGFGLYGELSLGTNPAKFDSDEDGLSDGEEIIGWQVQLVTADGIKVIQVSSNPLVKDTDADGLEDYLERELQINPTEKDTDEDGMYDKYESNIGTSLVNRDTDFDMLDDEFELTRAFQSTWIDTDKIAHTTTFYLNPLLNDSDADGISDYDEIYVYNSTGSSKDSDQDGLLDADEIALGTDIMRADTDGDGLADGLEVAGFEIPIVQMSGGKYAEDGSVIIAPEVYSYNVTVTTDPLSLDSDGDGLTDFEEVTGEGGETGMVSNPKSVDSDNDGINDYLDPERLVSDYTPADITSDIDITYTVDPSLSESTTVSTLITSLSTVWDLMTDAADMVADIIDYTWYWGEACCCWVCADVPKFRSWSSIYTYAQDKILDFVEDNLDNIFATLDQWNTVMTDTLSFIGFDLDIETNSWGIPVDISLSGSLSMMVKNIVDVISDIINPQINVQLTVHDDAGIKKIKVYQDGGYLREISNINTEYYHINEYFSTSKDGFSLDSTEIEFHIYDINDNIRVLSRETSVATFASDLLDDAITWIEETADAIVHALEDAWNWAIDGIVALGEAVVETVETVVDFVEETIDTIATWIEEQFAALWESFIRSILYVQSRIEANMELAGQYIDTAFGAYEGIRQKVVDGVDTVLAPAVKMVNDSLTDINEFIDEYMPPFDKSSIFGEMLGYLDFVQSLLPGEMIKKAMEWLMQKAMEILQEVIQEIIDSMMEKLFGPYYDLLIDEVESLFSQFIPYDESDQGEQDISLGGDEGSFITAILDTVNMIREIPRKLQEMLEYADGEHFMIIADAIFRDDPAKAISLHDILRTILTGAVAFGLAMVDLFSSDEETIPLSLDGFEPHAIRLDLEGNEITHLCMMIAQFVEIAIDEGVKFYEAADRGGDNDVEIEAQRKIISVATALHIIITTLDWIISFGENKSPFLWDDNYNDIFCRDFTMGVVQAIINIINCIVVYKVDKPVEKVVDWTFTVIDWLIKIGDAVWLSILFKTDDYKNQTSAEKDAMQWELIGAWLTVVQQIICDVTYHGAKIVEKVTHPVLKAIAVGLYAALSIARAGIAVAAAVFDFIADLKGDEESQLLNLLI
ncbi:MAG: PKD domain-containing protein [Candidatus Heimdallarchaeota archaeon]|nr:PKD domain-containing protein [Candidatus Heimdallarchaeota archaeon]